MTACNEALRDYPVAARLHVQYARSLIAAGRPEDAERAIADHVEIGYPSAMHVMAELYLKGGLGEDGDADYVTAEEWYLKAAEKATFWRRWIYTPCIWREHLASSATTLPRYAG